MNNNNYSREKAVAYARKWAHERNPAYYNFDSLGGDCTNFCSQCLYAGCGIMNYTRDTGWYYTSLNNRTAVTVAAHSDDSFDRTLGSYNYQLARLLRIEGARA
jgi:hypothetical protein